MLRMTLLLCATMVGALLIMGEDRGQMRPGLAKAAAEGPMPEAEPVPAPAAAAPIPEDVASAAPVAAPVAAPEPQTVSYAEPEREVVQALEEPIFTLSALGNELVPGEADAPLTPPVAAEADTGGTIWYVSASSVNVRAEPSTQSDVVGKLGNGEAALLVSAVNDEWARIVIQGDGMEGFVALRYLTPEAP